MRPTAAELLALLAPPASTPGRPLRPAGHFAAQGHLPAGRLRAVEIEDVGVMDEPLWPEAAEQLEEACAPAPFGWRDQTLLDARVRHTGEIDADRLCLVWDDGAFAQLQHAVAQALGLPAVEAHLHNLLVYAQGQFFKPHQDTEKHPRMVATLVLVWPCAHTGGTLRVWQGPQEALLHSAQAEGETGLRWFAFYADCRHEVLPVQSGWRVALTFDLVLPLSALPAPELDPAQQQALQTTLRHHFELDAPAPTAATLRPWVLLLEHAYTEHGLRWELLKGVDRHRVAALRTAAQALGLVMHLALAQQHESWSAVPEDGHNPWDDLDEDDDTYADDDPVHNDIDNMRPDDLLFREFSLDFWVDADNTVCSRSDLSIHEDEVASFTPTGRKFLEEQEYEGYMGNYGETLDYWYRRAAVVLQTPAGMAALRFKLTFDEALADLVAQAQQPEAATALGLAVTAALEPLSDRLTQDGRPRLSAYAQVAAALPDDDLAVRLLCNLPLWQLQAQDAPTLALLQQRRGRAWLQSLVDAWTRPDEPRRQMQAGLWLRPSAHPDTRLTPWPSPLPAFFQACQQAGLAPEVLDALLAAHRAWLVRWEAALLMAKPVHRQALSARHLALLNQLTQATLTLPEPQAAAHVQALVRQVLLQPALYPLAELVPFTLALGVWAGRTPQPQPLREQVTRWLETALAQPERSPEDQRLVDTPWACRCKVCQPLIAWAESPSGQPLVLPLATELREHVHAQVHASGAPIRTETVKKGRPYSLVLHKPGNAWEQEQAARTQWQHDLARLLRA